MNATCKKAMVTAAVVAATVLAVGCNKDSDTFDVLRLPYPKDDGATSSQTRIEYELIPNARIMTEDTRPAWPLGRHAFVPGENRLLVMTRITSYAQRDKDGKSLPGPENRYDKMVERFWLTIPPDLPVGVTLDFKEIREQSLIGYDRQNVGEPFYVYGASADGKITILEEKRDSVVFSFKARIQPGGNDEWGVNGIREIAYAPQGVWAEPPSPSELEEYLANKKAVAAAESEEGSLLIPNEGIDESELATNVMPVTTMVREEEHGAEGEDGTTAADEDAARAQLEEQRTKQFAQAVLGQWRGRSDDTDSWEWLFQFNADNTFVYSRSRGGRPYVFAGRYRIQGRYMVLFVDKFAPGGRRLADWHGDSRVLTARLGVEDDKLYFASKNMPRSEHKTATTAFKDELSKVELPDMRYTVITGINGKYKYGKMPQ